jgi:hypothetical protein
LRRATRQPALIPSFLPVNVLVNLIAVNQMDTYGSDSSDGGSEFPSQLTIPEPPFNDPNYETYKRGQQFMIVDHTANQRNGSEVSKIWQHGGELPLYRPQRRSPSSSLTVNLLLSDGRWCV